MARKTNIGSLDAAQRVKRIVENPQDDEAQALYYQHLANLQQSQSFNYVLDVWLRDNYCTPPYAQGLEERDAFVNIGRFLFLHELLVDLGRVKNAALQEVKTEATQNFEINSMGEIEVEGNDGP